jgi:NADH-quinone oxidoreductase subunit N
MNLFRYNATDHLALLPAILMALFACAIMLLDVLSPRSHAPQKSSKRGVVFFSLVATIFAAYSLGLQENAISHAPGLTVSALRGSVVIDALSVFTNVLVWFSTVILILSAYRYLEFAHEHRAEFYCLALFAQSGMYFMAGAVDLITLFVGLETSALAFYILVGFTRVNRQSNEAALKYLLLGAMASGFVAYGFSLLYGISGSTQLAEVAKAVLASGSSDPFVVLAVVTITVGLLFKIAAVPFHTWAPDAYEGAPTPITASLAVASKVAGFAVLIRLLLGTLASARPIWAPILAVTSVMSLTVGSIAALTQDRLKRFFAYSSIAHAGYVLLGFLADSEDGRRGILIYVFIYALMNLGAFALLISLRRQGIAGEMVSDLRGLSKNHPLHAALFVVFLLSLSGLPPTAGFIAKYFIFIALINTGHITLAVIAAAYVAVSLYFYFRLVREMYFFEPHTNEPLASSLGIRLALGITAALTLGIGLYPEPLLRVCFLVTGGVP